MPSTIAFTDVPGPDGAPVVVWTHGFLLHGGQYDDLVAALPEYRHILPDLPGHGRSAGATDAATLDGMAEAVWELTQDLGLDSFAVVGHSMGNAVGSRLVARHPEAVWAAVNLAGIPVTGKLEAARGGLSGMPSSAGDAAALTEMLSGLFVHEAPGSALVRAAGEGAALVPRDVIAQIVGTEFFLDDSAQLLPHLTQPWLVVVPALDGAEPAERQEAEAALLPDARVVMLEGEGHMVPQERPQVVADLLRGFLPR